MLKDGFQCSYHAALAAGQQALEQTQVEVVSVDWQDMYWKQKRRAEMWIAKYEKDIGPLEKVHPQATEPAPSMARAMVAEMDMNDRVLAAIDAESSGASPSTAGERAAFEAHIAKDCGDLSTFGRGKNMHYRNSSVNHEWEGWKARAALLQSAALPAKASHTYSEQIVPLVKPTTTFEKMQALYLAASNLMAYLGRDGAIQSDGHAADTLMNCLNDLDGGEFNDQLFAAMPVGELTPQMHLLDTPEPDKYVDCGDGRPLPMFHLSTLLQYGARLAAARSQPVRE